MNRILPPTSKIVRMVMATRVEYAAFRKLSSRTCSRISASFHLRLITL